MCVLCVYRVVCVCPHAPVGHLYSLFQCPVPSRVWTVRHSHCGLPRAVTWGNREGSAIEVVVSSLSLHWLTPQPSRASCLSSPHQLVGVGAKCLSVLLAPRRRKGILGTVLLSMPGLGGCGVRPFLQAGRWQALMESSLKGQLDLGLQAGPDTLGPSCSFP